MTDPKCKHCGRDKGNHKAHTLNCPANRSQFTYFLPNQVYEPRKVRKPKDPGFQITPDMVVGDE